MSLPFKVPSFNIASLDTKLLMPEALQGTHSIHILAIAETGIYLAIAEMGKRWLITPSVTFKTRTDEMALNPYEMPTTAMFDF